MGKVKLAMTHKNCRKTELMYFVFQNMSHWVFSGSDLQAALPNRLRWSLAPGGCQILAFAPRFSTYLHPIHSRPDHKREKFFLCHFPVGTHNSNKIPHISTHLHQSNASIHPRPDQKKREKFFSGPFSCWNRQCQISMDLSYQISTFLVISEKIDIWGTGVPEVN